MKKFVILLGAALVAVYGAEAASVLPDTTPDVLKGASPYVLQEYHKHAVKVGRNTVGRFVDDYYTPAPYTPAPTVVLEAYRSHAAGGAMQREALDYLSRYGLDVEKDIAGIMLIALDAFKSLDARDVRCLKHLVQHGDEPQKAFAQSAFATFIRICLCEEIEASTKNDFEACLEEYNTKKHVLSEILSPIARQFPWISNTIPMQNLGDGRG